MPDVFQIKSIRAIYKGFDTGVAPDHIISVHNGSDWVPYIVTSDGALTPVDSGSGSIEEIKTIDGGTAQGTE